MTWLSNLITRFLNTERSRQDLPLCDLNALSAAAQSGDVILLEGMSRVSDVIRWVTLSPWTHAALFIGPLDQLANPTLREAVRVHYQGPTDEPLLIESFLGHGTIVQPLNVYEGQHLRLARPRDLRSPDAARVVEYAISRLGAAYDVRQIFDLLRFLFPWFILPKRWRSSLFQLNSGKSTATVCSTMIAAAVGPGHIPILPWVLRQSDGSARYYRRNPKLCTPSDFDYSPYFDIIKYPLTGNFSGTRYDQIDWHSMTELTPQQQGLYVDQAFTASAHDIQQTD
jgi:hypothetical protein